MSATQTDFLRHLRSVMAKQANDALSDQQLLERFLSERSETSFAALVQRHGMMVFGVCQRILRHTQDAEDAFQATFLALARQAASIRRQESVGCWLHGVAYRIAEKMKRTAARRTAHESRLAPRPPGDALDDISWRELRSVLDEELRRLPEHYRAPLVLCYLEGRTQDEAARRLGWSKNTFGRRLERARQLLAQRLTRRGLTLTAALTAPVLLDSAATAAVPPLLAACTIRAGLAVANGQPLVALASASVMALAESGGQALLASKVKWALVLLTALGVGIGGVYTHSALSVRQAAEQPAAPSQAKIAPPPARGASKDTAIEIKGRVLDPDGKPLAGAKVYVSTYAFKDKRDPKVRAETGPDGRFRFTASRAEADRDETIVAIASDYGPDWLALDKADNGERTMRLVKDDVPIEGRVLDLEGKPIAGIQVKVDYVNARADGSDLTNWLQRQTKKSVIYGFDPPEFKVLPTKGLPLPTTMETDKDGRFRMTGFGRERIVHCQIEGPAIEKTIRWAATRSGPVGGWIPGHLGLYPAQFVYLAAPCKPIIGTVRDEATGKPLSGVAVEVVGVLRDLRSQAITDEYGHYRIVGAGKRKEYEMGTRKLPYFHTWRNDIADTPGLDPLTVDFKLTRGLVVRGRLLDKTTGQPVRGGVLSAPLADNPNLSDFTANGVRTTYYVETGADGRFTVVAVPGPGLLCAQGRPLNRFAPPNLKPWKTNLILEGYHVIDEINPSEKDAKSTVHDIALQPGRTLKGTVVGPDGRPLTGCVAAGLSPLYRTPGFGALPRLETANFTVSGIRPDCARTLMFIHSDKQGRFQFAKVFKLSAKESDPLTVPLEPLGELTGRIVDGAGHPRSGLDLSMVSMEADLPGHLPPDDRAWEKQMLTYVSVTDADGRFRFSYLVPGLKYHLSIWDRDTNRKSLLRTVTVASGKTKDLGDLKSERVPEKDAKEKP